MPCGHPETSRAGAEPAAPCRESGHPSLSPAGPRDGLVRRSALAHDGSHSTSSTSSVTDPMIKSAAVKAKPRRSQGHRYGGQACKWRTAQSQALSFALFDGAIFWNGQKARPPSRARSVSCRGNACAAPTAPRCRFSNPRRNAARRRRMGTASRRATPPVTHR